MPLTIGIVLFITLSYVVASLVLEMLYELVDPRLAAARQRAQEIRGRLLLAHFAETKFSFSGAGAGQG